MYKARNNPQQQDVISHSWRNRICRFEILIKLYTKKCVNEYHVPLNNFMQETYFKHGEISPPKSFKPMDMTQPR